MLPKYIFCGTWPRRTGGSISVSKGMALGEIPRRWFIAVEYKKISLYPWPFGKRTLPRVESHSRGRIFIGRFLKAAEIGRDIVVKASFNGSYLSIQPNSIRVKK
ncbi:MAG: hypothetical protein Q7R35_19740 [Elusimicrobiota bacterium]|nr:hypothetical protein [Elusimicrobiota bacterium]